jgi:hypothetical protein
VPLAFSAIGLLSDNSSVLSLDKKMRFYNIMDIYVSQIMSGEGFFKLSGMPELGIPGFVPTLATITYTKEQGKLKPKLEPISGVVDCNANLSFKLEQIPGSQSLSNKKYTAFGTFFINPPPGQSGDKLEVRGELIRTPNAAVINVVPEQQIAMGKEKMQVINGKIQVINNAWGNLAFKANTRSQGLDDKNELDFLVHGGVEVNSDNLTVDQINSPLGSLKMAYLFNEKALVGQLTVTNNLDLGFAAINGGMMNMRFDPDGYYLAFNGNVTISQQEYLGGFLLGMYQKNATAIAAKMLQGFQKNAPTLSSLHGFFVIGQRNLINKQFTIPLGYPLHASAKAGIGAYVLFDYQNPTFVVGGYAFINAQGGYNIPKPVDCFIGVSSENSFGIEGGYSEQAGLFISTCGTLSVNVSACGVSGGISIVNRTQISSKGNNAFSLELGDNCD